MKMHENRGPRSERGEADWYVGMESGRYEK